MRTKRDGYGGAVSPVGVPWMVAIDSGSVWPAVKAFVECG